MAKVYEGNVSIFKNSKDKIVVKADPNGAFNSESVEALASKMTELGRSLKAEVNFFIPETNSDKPIKAVLLANRWGSPYVAYLPEGKTSTRKPIEKLA